MKAVLFLIAFSIAGISMSLAQNATNDPQVSVNNYKHPNKAKVAANNDSRQHLSTGKAALRSQKTNKLVTKDYVLIPNNNAPSYNVQGKQTKANYKSQF